MKRIKQILLIMLVLNIGFIGTNNVKAMDNLLINGAYESNIYILAGESTAEKVDEISQENKKSINALDVCSKRGILQIFHIAGVVKDIIKILVPVLLIIVSTIDIGKAFLSGDDKDLKASGNVIVKRIIAGVIVFFIPTVVDVILLRVNGYNRDDYYNSSGGGRFGQCSICFASPSQSNCEGAAKN